MAVIKACATKQTARLSTAIKYVTNPSKTDQLGLVSGKDCNPQTVLVEMETTKALFDKGDGRQYKHFIQSFNPKDVIDPAKAHELGREFAEKSFPGHEVLVATHIDKNHLHNHFIVNSVNFEDGLKIQCSPIDLQKMKEFNDLICEREGLHVIKEKTPGKHLSMNEYQVAIKRESWKFKTMGVIDQVMERAQTKGEFVKDMEAQGYQVKWTDQRKNITYTTPDGHKVRDNKLHDPNYLKEAMENEFKYRRTKEIELQTSEQGRSANNSKTNILTRANRDHSGEYPNHIGRTIESVGTNSGENSTKRDKRNESDQEIRGKREATEPRNQGFQVIGSGLEQENGRVERRKLSKVGEGFSDNQRGSEKQPRNQQQNNSRGHGVSAPGRIHSKTELEGTGEAIRNTTSDNARTSDRTSRSIPPGNFINDAIKTLGSSLEKVQQEEKLKAELMKEKLEQKMKAPQKTRSKGRDWGPEL